MYIENHQQLGHPISSIDKMDHKSCFDDAFVYIFKKKWSTPCLDALKIPKFYKISHHIESLNACMKY